MIVKNKYTAGFIVLTLILTSAIGCRNLTGGPAQTGWSPDLPKGVTIDLPRETSNADADNRVLAESAVVISIPSADQLYLGKERVSKDQLGARIDQLIKKQSGPDKTVYIASGVGVAYGTVLEVIEIIRGLEIDRIGFIAGSKDHHDNVPRRLRVRIPAKAAATNAIGSKAAQLTEIKPNPLMLVVSISSDLKLELNRGHQGAVNDQTLRFELGEIFRQRIEQHVYEPGMEARTDLPEEERIEKTVFIKAPRSLMYGDVIKVIDMVTGVGAYPVGLQLDDLPN